MRYRVTVELADPEKIDGLANSMRTFGFLGVETPVDKLYDIVGEIDIKSLEYQNDVSFMLKAGGGVIIRYTPLD